MVFYFYFQLEEYREMGPALEAMNRDLFEAVLTDSEYQYRWFNPIAIMVGPFSWLFSVLEIYVRGGGWVGFTPPPPPGTGPDTHPNYPMYCTTTFFIYIHTVNCSYTGLGLGLRFSVRYRRNPVYPNTRLCTKHTVSCFCAGLKFSVRYVRIPV